MSKYQCGFIGAGNMGGALAAAVCKRCSPDQVIVYDRADAKMEELAGKLGCVAADDIEQVARESRFIFLGVKPQAMGDMLSEISDVLEDRTDRFTLVTMAAGMTIDQICRMAGNDYPVIRIMPNTPVAVGEGMVLYTANEEGAEELAAFTAFLSSAGELDELPEKLIDAGCALSGCGPAFVCQFVEALADGAVECGLPRDKAMLYAMQTVLGTAKLMSESGQHPAVLKDAVCSPGGSTIAGVHALEDGGLRGTVMDAVCAAYERTQELGK